MQEEIKYMNEVEALTMLDVKQTTLRNLVKKKLLSKYVIGSKHYYKPDEINDLIESRKVHDRKVEALKEFENVPPFNKHEHQWIITKANTILWLIYDLDNIFGDTRDFNILRKLIKYTGNFESVADEYDLSKERVRQIFERGLRRLRAKCNVMKKEYYQNYEAVQKQNIALISENKKLVEYVKQLPEEQQKIIQGRIDKTGIYAIKIRDLDLSVRAATCLRNCEIETLGELVAYEKYETLRFRNLGKHTGYELDDIIRHYGLRYGETKINKMV
jgi:hypothetical protein